VEPTTSKYDPRQDIDKLPDELQQWCLGGKSVSDTAHLAKNIIQMVSGSAEIIELGMNKKQYDRVQKSWALLKPNLKRLQKYVLDLIKYTRHYPIDKSVCNLNELVNHVIRRCERGFKNYAVRIEYIENPNIEPVSVDAEMLQEMLSNLITHAADNLSDHAGIIRIEITCLKNHQQIQISVCDDGPALNNEAIRSLREPKERVQNMCGTGFEIALATLYAEQHDGYIDFESSQGKGNSVHVYLPVE
jgi:K+-sensing histidine kinase KdpD